MKQIICIIAILIFSVCLIPGVFAQTLMSDEFNGTGQNSSILLASQGRR